MKRQIIKSTLLLSLIAAGVVACNNGDSNKSNQYIKPITEHLQNMLYADSDLSGRVPLHTSGAAIVDKNGERVQLKSANWYGASGSAVIANSAGTPYFDGTHHNDLDTYNIPAGLATLSLDTIVQQIHSLKLNSIRLPFSNEMLHIKTAAPNGAVVANPQLMGKTPLEIYDAVIQKLTDNGIMVILNNHTTLSSWCCGYDPNGLWYTYWNNGDTIRGQNLEQWVNDWVMLVNRYKNNQMVIGADLRNEVRTQPDAVIPLPINPTWGEQNQNDWHAAATIAGNNILKNNPHLLIIVEGINWTNAGITTSGTRFHLAPVKNIPISLIKQDQLVYSVHTYGYTGPNHAGGNVGDGKLYQHMSRADLFKQFDKEFGYLVQNNIAPVWVSEFGVGYTNKDDKNLDENTDQEQIWFRNLTDYMTSYNLDYAYWPLYEPGNWALISLDQNGPTIFDNGARKENWDKIANQATQEKKSPDEDRTIITSAISTSFNISDNSKEVRCPDDYYLLGAWDRKYSPGLCVHKHGTMLDLNNDTQELISDERYVKSHTGGDWAYNVSKRECPSGKVVSGYNANNTEAICKSPTLSANQDLKNSNDCRTIWFNKGTNQDSSYGDWAYGYNKGAASKDEYIAGVGFDGRTPVVLLACHINNDAS